MDSVGENVEEETRNRREQNWNFF